MLLSFSTGGMFMKVVATFHPELLLQHILWGLTSSSQLKVTYLCDWFLQSVEFSSPKVGFDKVDQMVSSRIIDLIQIYILQFSNPVLFVSCDICILCSVYHSSNVTLGGQTGQSCEHRRVNKLNTKFAPKLNSTPLKCIALLDVISSA